MKLGDPVLFLGAEQKFTDLLIKAVLCFGHRLPSCPLTWETRESHQLSISLLSSYCLVTFYFPKLG